MRVRAQSTCMEMHSGPCRSVSATYVGYADLGGCEADGYWVGSTASGFSHASLILGLSRCRGVPGTSPRCTEGRLSLSPYTVQMFAIQPLSHSSLDDII